MDGSSNWLEANKEERKKELKKKIIDSNLELFDLGNGAENFLRAVIQRQERPYDVFKPEVDYGIDLMALDRESVIDGDPKLFFFQVKSTVLQEFEQKEIDGIRSKRPVLPFHVKVAWSTLNLMASMTSDPENPKDYSRFALVIALYPGEKVLPHLGYPFMDRTDLPLMYFWIDSDDLLKFSDAVNGGEGHELNPYEEYEESALGTYYFINGNLVLPDPGEEEKQNPYILLQKNTNSFESDPKKRFFVGTNGGSKDTGGIGPEHFSMKRFLER